MKKNLKIALVAIIIAVLGVFAYDTFLGGNIIPDDLNPANNNERIYISFPIVNALNGTELSGATVLLRGEDGVVASKASTSSGFTSNGKYDEGEQVEYLITLSGHYSVEGTFTVPFGDYSVKTTEVLPAIQMFEASSSVSMTVEDQNGDSITASTAYNTTTDGTTLTLNMRVSLADTDVAFGNAYDNWNTGYEYSGPFLVLSSTSNLLVVSGADLVQYDGTEWHYIVWLNQFYNDANINTDGSVTVSLTIDCQTTGTDVLDAKVFDEVRSDYIPTSNFGTADASVLNMDIVDNS